jgi:hypothetical protein
METKSAPQCGTAGGSQISWAVLVIIGGTAHTSDDCSRPSSCCTTCVDNGMIRTADSMSGTVGESQSLAIVVPVISGVHLRRNLAEAFLQLTHALRHRPQLSLEPLTHLGSQSLEPLVHLLHDRHLRASPAPRRPAAPPEMLVNLSLGRQRW